MNHNVVVPALCVLLLAACSSPGPASSSATPTAPSATPSIASPAVTPTPTPTAPSVDTTAELKQAVIDYTNAYFAADWDTAFTRLWSDRCKADNTARNSLTGELAAQKVNYPGTAKPQAGVVTVDRLAGDLAMVTYNYSFNGKTSTVKSQPWTHVGGTWQFDAC